MKQGGDDLNENFSLLRNFYHLKWVGEFDKILKRIKSNAKNFLDKQKEDDLIEPLIEGSKPSQIGQHSAVFKTLNW